MSLASRGREQKHGLGTCQWQRCRAVGHSRSLEGLRSDSGEVSIHATSPVCSSVKLMPLGFQKPRPSKPTFQLPQHLYPSCLAQLAVFTCCPLLFLGGLICFDRFSSVNCSEDGPRNGAMRQKDVTCSIAWSGYIRIDFFNMFFLNTSEQNHSSLYQWINIELKIAHFLNSDTKR